MKYLRKFETEADKNAWREGDSHVTPNVVLTEGAVDYNVSAIRKGVFIQHIDGKLYTKEGWINGGYSNDEANGVAVCDVACSFVIAKADAYAEKLVWGSNTSSAISGVMLASDSATANTDYAGASNTELIAATSGAAYECANYAFPNGATGYLPALGEWAVAYANKSAINDAMALIEGTAISDTYYWSSTQSTATGAWKLSWKTGSTNPYDRGSSGCARAFSAL